MDFENSTRDQLLKELQALRQRLAESEGRTGQESENGGQVHPPGAGSHTDWQRTFRTLSEAVQECLCIFDEDGGILEVNRRMAAITGFPQDDLREKNVWHLYPPEDEQRLKAALAEGGEAGTDLIPAILLTKTGERVNTEVRILSLSRDGPKAYLAISRDLTSHLRLEQRLAEALALNRTIVETSSLGIAAFKAQGQCVFVNEAAIRIIGGNRETILQQNFHHLSSWQTSGLLTTALRALASGREERQEIHTVSIFGKELWMDCRFITFTSGGEPHLLLLIDEITARKQAEALLEESRAELEKRVQERTLELSRTNAGYQVEIRERRQAEAALKSERDFVAALLDTVGALVVVLDREGRIVRFNHACQAATGYGAEEVMGRYVWDYFLLPEERGAVQGVFHNLTAGHFPSTYENHWLTKDGGKILISWSNTALMGNDRQVEYVIATGIDVTAARQAEAALRDSEERYSSLFENNHAVMLLIDPETGDIVDANPAACSFYGFSRAELTAKKITDINTLSPEEVFAEMERARARERQVFYFRHRLADGEIRDVEVYSGPIEVRGKPLLYSIIHDITERRLAEEALRESEARFRELAENIREVFWTFDWHSQKVLYASTAYEQVYGRSVQALYEDYHEWTQSVHPDDIAYARESFRKILETGGGEPREYRILRPDGAIRWVSDRGFAIRGPNGSIDRIVGIAEDITARKLAEERLKAAEAEKALVLSSISELVVFYDADMRLKWANRVVEEALATPLEGLIGRHCYEIWHGRTALCEGCLAITTMASGESQRGEMTFADGKSWLLAGTPVKDPDGLVIGVVETALDITARKQAEAALRQSEERFRAIFDHVSVGMALVDANGCVLMANDADCRFLGYPREELVGLHFSVFTHPDDMAIDAELYESLVKGERESYDIDKRYIRKDGDIVWGRLSVSLVRDEQGQPQYTVIACEDITEQRLAEEALKRSQRQLKAILDNIPDLAWLKDRESRFIAVNEPFGQACGVRPENLVGQTDLDIWPRELAEGYQADDREVMRSRKRKQVEEPLATKDGVATWIETIKTPIYDELGEVIGTTGIARDITDRRIAQEALKASEEKYRLLVKNIPAVVFRGYPDWSVDFFDDKIEELTSYPKADFDSRRLKWSDVVFPEDLSTLKEATKQALEATGSYVREYRIRNKAGQIRWLQARAQIICNDQGKIDFISGVFFDITSQKHLEEALRATKERLQFLLSATPVVIFSARPHGDFGATFVSDNITELLGFEPREFLEDSRFWQDHVHPEDLPGVTADLHHLFATGYQTLNYRFRHKNGAYRWMLEESRLVLDAAGNPQEIVGYWLDITERRRLAEELERHQKHLEQLVAERTAALTQVNKKLLEEIAERERTEAALRESEEKYRTIVETAQEGVWMIDPEEKTSYVNRRLAEMLGYKPEEMLGAHLFAFMDEEGRRQAEESLKQTYAGVREVFEFRFRRQDGSDLWTIISTNPLFDGQSQYMGALGMLTDITERHRAETALKESEVRLRTIFDGAPIGIGMTDLTGRMLEMNLVFTQMLGYSLDELRRMNHLDLMQPDSRATHEQLFKEMAEGRRDSFRSEICYLPKDGTTRWGLVHASLVRDTRGAPRFAIGMMQDITREKQAQAELAQYQENSRSMASELSLTEERERRRLAEFLHDDIGQALALAKIKLGGLQQAREPEKQLSEVREFLEQAIKSTRNLTFELSLPILYEMGLVEAVEWLAEQFQTQHHIKVEVRHDQHPKPLGEGARVLLFRLVRELLTNIVKHAKASRAEISLLRQGHYLHIRVEDDGIGFDAGQKLSLPDAAGGFGLFSVRERLSHLGGLMEVQSTPGEGTQITITVPLQEAEEFPPVP